MSTPLTTPVVAHEDLLQRAQDLHREVQGALQHGFGETLADLQQLRGLLGDATTKLSAAFQAMIHQARSQQVAAARLEADVGAGGAREIRQLAEEITRGSLLVVQSLQFEDMANQLLQHVDRRLGWLEQFARDAAPLHSAVSLGVVGLTPEDFGAVEASLARQRDDLRGWRHKAVQQESLDEGDVELF